MSDTNLPPNWFWVKLGDIADYFNGRAFKISEWEKDGLPIIRIKNLNSVKAEYNFSKKKYEEKYLIKQGDLLFAWSASLGVYIWNNSDAWLNQHIFKVIPRNNIKKEFLFYSLKQIVNSLYAKTHGSGIVHVTKEKFEETKIPLPPVMEQNKIIEKIEELFSELDSGVAALKKAKEQIKTYRQAVLEYGFSGRLLDHLNPIQVRDDIGKAAGPQIAYSKQLPEGWKWVKLGDVVNSVKYGTSKKCYYDKRRIPVLRIPNIINGFIDDSDLKYSEFTKDEISKLSINENDILIIRSNGSLSIVGKSAIVSKKHKDFLFAGYLIRIRLKTELYNSKFLNLLLSSNQLRIQIEFKAKSTSGVNNINAQEIKALEIPLAPLDQQFQIVEEIEKRFSEADNLEKAIDESLAKAESLRQSILKQAFEGKLVSHQEIQKQVTHFQKIQVIGAIIKGMEIYNYHKGEMIIAKYIYLVDKIYKLNLGFKYQKWHFGPYSPEIKKILNKRNGYFVRSGWGKSSFFKLTKEDKLFSYSNNLVDAVEKNLPGLINVFEKYKNTKERDHKIELLASVCKIIEDDKVIDSQEVYEKLKEWKTDEKITGFKNKAGKFNENEVRRSLDFIKKQGWIELLVPKY